MTSTETLQPKTVTQASKRLEADRVQRELDDLCEALGPGGRLPRHTELMRRFDASERNIMRSLEELQRRGRIVRRHGSGTFITDKDEVDAQTPGTEKVLAESRSIVAIARPDMSFFDRCLELLHGHAESAELELVCRLIGPNQDAQVNPVAFGTPAGFVVLHYQLEPIAKQLLDAGNRVVIVGTPPIGVTPDVPCVHGDHEHGGYLSVKHLIDLGHRKIVFLDANDDLQETVRWRGNMRAVKDATRSGKFVEVVVLGSIDCVKLIENPPQMAEFFRQSDAPTAIVAWNDKDAIRLLGQLNRAGIRIPEDVSLIGYDASPDGEVMHPSLTTVDHGVDQQLNAAIDLLTRPVPPATNYSLLYAPTLVPRESTAPPKTSFANS